MTVDDGIFHDSMISIWARSKEKFAANIVDIWMVSEIEVGGMVNVDDNTLHELRMGQLGTRHVKADDNTRNWLLEDEVKENADENGFDGWKAMFEKGPEVPEEEIVLPKTMVEETVDEKKRDVS